MANKRKRDQDATTAKANDGPASQHSSASATSKGQRKQEKSERRSKKQKRLQEDGADTSSKTAVPVITADAPEDETAGGESLTAEDEMNAQATSKSKTKSRRTKKDASTNKVPARFIVFVGNLPFDTTVNEVREHFAKLNPAAVRLSTDKKTGRGKGFAFLEFDAYDKMKTCLSLYHHSIFDPHKSSADGAEDETSQMLHGEKKRGRRINVELTAGGGGKKSSERRAKIKTKNQKLDEERQRRRAKEKAEQEKESTKMEGPETGANATTGAINRSAIHPSRLSRVSHH